MQGRPDGRKMKFTKNELIMVGRHASGGREETIEKLDRERAVSEDALDRAFMYNAAALLPGCGRQWQRWTVPYAGSLHWPGQKKTLYSGMTCQAGSVSRKTQGI